MKQAIMMALAVLPVLGFAGENLTILTFNIRHGLGLDGKIDLARTAAAVAREKPRFVGLQEVDQKTVRVAGADTCAVIAEKTGLVATFAKAIDFAGGEYGNAVLSREKPISVRRIPLPGGEPRVLLLCEFADCWFGTMHLAVDSDKARIESVEIVRKAVAACGAKPVFLSGDWNATPDEPVLKDIAAFATVLSPTGQKTFYDKRNLCLDYIAIDRAHRASYSVTASRVVADAVTSDHRPVVVTLSPADQVLLIDFKSQRCRTAFMPHVWEKGDR